jgi:hypothetical protein
MRSQFLVSVQVEVVLVEVLLVQGFDAKKITGQQAKGPTSKTPRNYYRGVLLKKRRRH